LHNIHHQLMNLIIDDVDRTIARTGKSSKQIINDLKCLHPEITFKLKDWDQLCQQTQDVAIVRIKKTLASMT